MQINTMLKTYYILTMETLIETQEVFARTFLLNINRQSIQQNNVVVHSHLFHLLPHEASQNCLVVHSC